MLKKIVIVCGVLLLFMTACGSDKDSSAPADKDETAAPTAVATAEPTKEAKAGGGLEDVFQPLSLMGGPLFGASGDGLDMEGGSQNVDPELKAALLTAEDLPPGYSGLGGDIGYSMGMPEGSVSMAARMFFEGDVMSGEPGSIVMSAVRAMPANALDEFDASIAKLEKMDLSPEGIEKMVGESGMQGMKFKELRLTKTPGLGEAGVNMYMVMDMSGAAGGLGAEMGAYENGIAMDAYMFKRGGRVLMLVVMWPAGEQPDVDGLALAEVMDARAQ
jgi:hypothetical protein